MEQITLANIEKEIFHIIEHKPMTRENLEAFVLLSRAIKYMKHVHRQFTEEDAKEWVFSTVPFLMTSLTIMTNQVFTGMTSKKS